MKSFSKLMLALGLAGIAAVAAHADNVVQYDAGTRYLTVPGIAIGNAQYNNVVIRIDSAAIVAIGSSSKISGDGAVAAKCTAANISAENAAKIKVGMSLDDVNQALGCQYTPATPIPTVGAPAPDYVLYTWWGDVFNSIQVSFDVKGAKVQPAGQGGKIVFGPF